MNAFDLTCGAELESFIPSTVLINRTRYTVLTGYEGEKHRCFWCGKDLNGSKLKRYCRGHMMIYYDHFDWNYASVAAMKRANYKCENCGAGESRYLDRWKSKQTQIQVYRTGALEIHHIVPLKGETRQFSAYNLSWNLVVLCHDCHVGPGGIHAAMRPPKPEKPLSDPIGGPLFKKESNWK